MLNRKRTLPRHTVLAGQGNRIGAFLADFAMMATAFVLLFLGFSKLVFASVTNPLQDQQNLEEYNAGLIVRDGDDYKKITTDDYQDYVNSLKYHFLCYMNGENIDDDKEPYRYAEAGKYTVEWFNKTILEIPENPDNDKNSLFTYDGGDKTKIGIPKESSNKLEVNSLVKGKYIQVFTEFLDIDFMAKITNKSSLIFTVEFVLSSLISGAIFYIIIPLAMENGQTLGKKMFGLALANKEGYKISNWQIPMRFVPFALTNLVLFIPFIDMLGILLVALTIFLSSFAFAMASPKRMSLHDLTGGTIVVNKVDSIIFKDVHEEEEYIFKEDGITGEEEIIDE